ncbi:hypothetical protein FRZ61_50190 [Hypericibacter adhaerens]|uniref:Uncharacterized protein n=1 Tax=Hypericibacter adhaerens TaxID=2602016 RepID=A0A5J6N6E2_9PROT|nr:hypothetical protein FRZ61_50190 [Hypericibacter adhaerens]
MRDREHRTFLIRYTYGGAEWGLELPARSLEDAKARLERLSYATIDGELVLTLPAAIGPLAAVIAKIRNALQAALPPKRRRARRGY